MLQSLELSVIVPVYNEADALLALLAEMDAALEGRSFEVIIVDDASTDDTLATLGAQKSAFTWLRVIGHRQNAGQSRAILTGVRAARGHIIATLDGDGQNDPADLPDLYRQLMRADAPETLAMVMGRRDIRNDGLAKRTASRLANLIRGWLLGDGAEDSGCGIKVIRRDVFLRLPYFDHMHRYMPALVQAEGLSVEFAAVHHRPRQSGRSKYTNWGRLLSALSDMQGVRWLARRRRTIGGADEI